MPTTGHVGPRETASRRQREAARAELFTELLNHEPEDIPCVGGPLWSALWTSEEPALQRMAAEACSTCPVLTECAIFGLLYPDEAGVYGGTTEMERNPEGRRTGRPRKTQPEEQAS